MHHRWPSGSEPACNFFGIEANSALNAEARNKARRCEVVDMLGCHLQYLSQLADLQCRGPLFDLLQYSHQTLFCVCSRYDPLAVPAFDLFRRTDDRIRRKPCSTGKISPCGHLLLTVKLGQIPARDGLKEYTSVAKSIGRSKSVRSIPSARVNQTSLS